MSSGWMAGLALAACCVFGACNRADNVHPEELVGGWMVDPLVEEEKLVLKIILLGNGQGILHKTGKSYPGVPLLVDSDGVTWATYKDRLFFFYNDSSKYEEFGRYTISGGKLVVKNKLEDDAVTYRKLY